MKHSHTSCMQINPTHSQGFHCPGKDTVNHVTVELVTFAERSEQSFSVWRTMHSRRCAPSPASTGGTVRGSDDTTSGLSRVSGVSGARHPGWHTLQAAVCFAAARQARGLPKPRNTQPWSRVRWTLNRSKSRSLEREQLNTKSCLGVSDISAFVAMLSTSRKNFMRQQSLSYSEMNLVPSLTKGTFKNGCCCWVFFNLFFFLLLEKLN